MPKNWKVIRTTDINGSYLSQACKYAVLEKVASLYTHVIFKTEGDMTRAEVGSPKFSSRKHCQHSRIPLCLLPVTVAKIKPIFLSCNSIYDFTCVGNIYTHTHIHMVKQYKLFYIVSLTFIVCEYLYFCVQLDCSFSLLHGISL